MSENLVYPGLSMGVSMGDPLDGAMSCPGERQLIWLHWGQIALGDTLQEG